MVEKENIGKRLYRQAWSRTGSKPWTYLARDSIKVHPLAWLLSALGLGVLLGHIFWNTSEEDDDEFND